MKTLKYIIATTFIALVVYSNTAKAEINFQKVYEVPNMTAEQIKQAYGEPTIDVGVDKMSLLSDAMDTALGQGWMLGLETAKTGKIRCNIGLAKWLPAVNDWTEANVAFQVKDGRARVTVANLAVHGPGKKQCIASIEKHLDQKFSMLKSLDNNW